MILLLRSTNPPWGGGGWGRVNNVFKGFGHVNYVFKDFRHVLYVFRVSTHCKEYESMEMSTDSELASDIEQLNIVWLLRAYRRVFSLFVDGK